MTRYTAAVEALGYGDADAEAAALMAALGAMGLEETVEWTVMADGTKGMLLVALTLEAIHALDVHELAFNLWQEAWTAAFPEHAPTEVFAMRCVPAAVRAAA